jgi:hypothetical protein
MKGWTIPIEKHLLVEEGLGLDMFFPSGQHVHWDMQHGEARATKGMKGWSLHGFQRLLGL